MYISHKINFQLKRLLNKLLSFMNLKDICGAIVSGRNANFIIPLWFLHILDLQYHVQIILNEMLDSQNGRLVAFQN